MKAITYDFDVITDAPAPRRIPPQPAERPPQPDAQGERRAAPPAREPGEQVRAAE